MVTTPETIQVGVSGILHRNGCVLVGCRARTETYPGMYCTPGGGVDFRESLHDALKREFLEETELNIDRVGDLVCVREKINPAEGRHVVIMFYEVHVAIELHPQPSPELDSYVWLPVAHVATTSLPLTPATRAALIDFVNLRYA